MPRRRFVHRSQLETRLLPFADAEEAWFWFIRCQRARNDGVRFDPAAANAARPCDPDDLYRAVIGLAGARRIGRRHLRVLEDFGLCERPPDPRNRDEEVSARLWNEALDKLSTVLKTKGIIL